MTNWKKFLWIAAIGFSLNACSMLTDSAKSTDEQPAANVEQPATDQSVDGSGPSDDGETAEESLLPKDGVAGNYLAGRAALENSDFTASAEFLQKTLDKDPSNASLIERTCVLYILSGQIDRAVPLATAWAAVKPKALIPNLTLLLHAVKTDNWDMARVYAAAIEEAKSNKLASSSIKAWLATQSGDMETADAVLKPLLIDPASGGVAAMHAGLMAEYRHDYAAAFQYYAMAIPRFQIVPLRLAMNAGHVFERIAEPQKARELYDAFTKRSPSNYVFDSAMARIERGEVAPANIRTTAEGFANIMFDIATFFEGQQTHESALVYAQLAHYLAPDFEFNQLLLSELLESFEQYKHAAKINESLIHHPTFGWAAGLRLAREYEKMNQEPKAVALLSDMRQKFPKRVESVTLLGDIYRGKKDYAAAIEAYSQAIENSNNGDDNLWALYYARGTAFERAQLWTSAEADLKKSLELSPDQPYVLNYLAYSWVDRNINLEDAKKMLTRAVELAPQDAFIIDSLGWLHYKMGSYDDAEDLLQLAVEIRPYDPQLIDHYGDVLWQLNKREQAAIQWKRAMSFGPDQDLKKSLEAKIKNGLPPASGESKPQGQAMDSGQQQ